MFVGADAGAGKSVLVTAFTATCGVRVLRGGCDGGLTAAPLGPLADVRGGDLDAAATLSADLLRHPASRR